MARRVLVVIAGLLGVWLLLVILAFVFQRQLIYLPDGSRPAAPADVEEVTLRTDDGLELTAWFLTPDDAPVSTILVTPGNAGTRALRLPLARGLVARGHAVLLLDYRGYGGNPGRPSEAGLRRDALAARDHLEARPDVDADRIVHLGESIGTGAATWLSTQRQPAALVLRSPFPSLADVAADHYGAVLPVRLLLREEHPIAAQLPAVDAPLLVVAGGADRIVRTERSRAVAEAFADVYVELEGVDHNDRDLLDGDRYLDAVDRFVRDTIGEP